MRNSLRSHSNYSPVINHRCGGPVQIDPKADALRMIEAGLERYAAILRSSDHVAIGGVLAEIKRSGIEIRCLPR